MSEYLTKEEIKQWRSSLEKITLEEYAARVGKKLEEEKEHAEEDLQQQQVCFFLRGGWRSEGGCQ